MWVGEGEEPFGGLRWVFVLVLDALFTLYAAGGCDLEAFCMAFTVAFVEKNRMKWQHDAMEFIR